MKRWRIVLSVTGKEIYEVEAETLDAATDRIEAEGLDPVRTDAWDAEFESGEEIEPLVERN